MKKTKVILLTTLLVTLILEILPYGAVCNFIDPDIQIRKTYSYFDITPFGYANFGPLLTAMLTCVLIALGVVYLFFNSRGLGMSLSIVSVLAFAVSLAPLLYGYRYFSLIGAFISMMLAAVFFFSIRITKFL